MDFVKILESLSQEAQYPEGMEGAIIGIATRKGTTCLVMSRDKCLEILMKDNGWDNFEALEWMEFNVEGAYVGDDTPYFVDEEWGGS